MTLLSMKSSFESLTDTAQMEFFEKYTAQRIQDLNQPLVSPRTKGKRKKGGKQIKLTNEQYDLLQKLGLV